MKKIIILMLLITTFLQADRYLLIMSKDDKVCQRVTKIFNDDLFKYKELKLQSHEEFNAIKWDKEFKFFDSNYDKEIKDSRSGCPGYTSNYEGCKNAIFDINNDGKKELVHFQDEYIGKYPFYNSIYYINQDIKTPLEFHFNKKLTYIRGNVKFTKLPVQRMDKFDGTTSVYLSSDNYILLRPFRINRKYYLTRFSSTYGQGEVSGNSINSKNINDNDFISIIKYDKTNKSTDTCYLIKVFTNKNYINKDK